MNLSDQINADIKSAMIAKERGRLDALRAVKAAFLLEGTEKGKSGDLSEEDSVAIIQKLVKQRKESLSIFQEQGREDLAEVEQEQIGVLEIYLPAQMSDDDLKEELSGLLSKIGASAAADMGKAMGAASKAFAGRW